LPIWWKDIDSLKQFTTLTTTEKLSEEELDRISKVKYDVESEGGDNNVKEEVSKGRVSYTLHIHDDLLFHPFLISFHLVSSQPT
jgi:hypothetical protein